MNFTSQVQKVVSVEPVLLSQWVQSGASDETQHINVRRMYHLCLWLINMSGADCLRILFKHLQSEDFINWMGNSIIEGHSFPNLSLEFMTVHVQERTRNTSLQLLFSSQITVLHFKYDQQSIYGISFEHTNFSHYSIITSFLHHNNCLPDLKEKKLEKFTTLWPLTTNFTWKWLLESDLCFWFWTDSENTSIRWPTNQVWGLNHFTFNPTCMRIYSLFWALCDWM